jgi:hypothetical protein
MEVRSALALTVFLALTACPSASAELAVGSRSAGEGWVVRVSVEPSGQGPIAVSVGAIGRAPVTDAHAWLQHDLVLENRGDRPVSFADTRTGAFLGPRGRRVLLAADQGCGYGISERRIELACLLYLDLLTLEPHEAVPRTVTLWKGLRGMKPLEPGTYVFRKKLRFRVGRVPPPVGTGRTAILRIVYRVGAADGSGPPAPGRNSS